MADVGAKELEGKSKEMKSNVSIDKKKNSPERSPPSKLSLKKLSSASNSSDESDMSSVVKKQSELDKIARAPRFQNTYRLDSKFPFKSGEVHRIIASIVDKEGMENPHYDGNAMAKMAQMICGEVRASIKLLNYDRYKICVLVYVGENRLQGFHSAFRALWDPERDSWASYYWHCRTYFISCTCFGLYHD